MNINGKKYLKVNKMCIKRQAQDIVDVMLKRLDVSFKNDEYIKTGFAYAISVTCKIKDKNSSHYLKFKEKLLANKKIETKDYVLTYDMGFLKIEKRK